MYMYIHVFVILLQRFDAPHVNTYIHIYIHTCNHHAAANILCVACKHIHTCILTCIHRYIHYLTINVAVFDLYCCSI